MKRRFSITPASSPHIRQVSSTRTVVGLDLGVGRLGGSSGGSGLTAEASSSTLHRTRGETAHDVALHEQVNQHRWSREQ
jgi:hypothetical protein